MQLYTKPPDPTIRNPNPYRHESTASVLAAVDVWANTVAELDVDGGYACPESSRAFALWHYEQATAELARRERLRRRHPLAAAAWPDRRGELEEIRSRVDLVELVRKYAPVELVGHGRRLRCRCPLPGHTTDDTPSFTIYRDQGRWHCFGCGRGGDCFDYILILLDCRSFADAVDWLAIAAGVERRPLRASPTSPTRRLRAREVTRA